MYSVNLTKETLNIEKKDQQIFIEGEPLEWDLRKISANQYLIHHQHKSYTLELIHADYDAKTFKVKLNNKTMELVVKDKFDLLLEKMGMNNQASQELKEIKAPMPGLIHEIKVAVGDEVKKGDPILILEAMKMENIIKSPGEGKVKHIKIEKGQSVEKNQVLIQF
jgi:biotin carboxyl carrier protein